MGRRTEEQTIEFCDICKRSEGRSLLTNCFVCERDFCMSCKAPIRENTYFNHEHICKECILKPAVREVQEAFRSVYWGLTKKEQEAFKKVGVQLKKREATDG